MANLINGEFEKLESIKISDVSLTCNTSLEIFNEEFNQISIMEDDLFTYEVEIAEVTNIPCDLQKEDDLELQMSHESDDDLEYDPSDVEFTKCGDNEVELTNKESSDSDDEDEVAKIFRIETNMYLLKILMDLRLTENIMMIRYMTGIKICHGCMKDKGRSMEGNLPGAYTISNTLRYQNLEWYKALKDDKLKEEALENKAIMDGMIEKHDDLSNEGWKGWDDFEITNHNNEESKNEMEHEEEERCKVFDDHEWPICYIRRFEMVKYSFKDDKEHVAIKENEYDDLTNTSKDAIYAYQ
nr:hypothetical protein [Tanacetum cinerariifolium]